VRAGQKGQTQVQAFGSASLGRLLYEHRAASTRPYRLCNASRLSAS